MTYTIPVYRGDERESGTQGGPGGPNAVVVSRYVGAARIATGSRNVGSSPVIVVGSSAVRRTVTIQNLGSNDVYIGGEDVSVSNGYKIAADAALTLELAGELWAVTESTTENVRYLLEVDA